MTQKYYEGYYVDGILHRDPTLGPAHIRWYENGQKYYERYYVNGKYHRDPKLGPAHTYWHPNGQKYCEKYYVNGWYEYCCVKGKNIRKGKFED